MSQCEMILEYMKEKGSITPLEALNELGCMRLGARIWDLRHEGHNIRREMVLDAKSNKRWAKYYFVR